MKKVAVIVLIFILLVFLYGVISWRVFRKSTFLGLPVDCFPQVIDSRNTGGDLEQPKQGNLWKTLFGVKCVTW